MRIENRTKATVIAERVQKATTFWTRLKGLLGTGSLPAQSGLIIKPCSSVHTFGMCYPIDVLFVDRNHYIVKIVENMPPGKVSMADGSHYVVELPIGTVERTVCSVGDQLECQ